MPNKINIDCAVAETGMVMVEWVNHLTSKNVALTNEKLADYLAGIASGLLVGGISEKDVEKIIDRVAAISAEAAAGAKIPTK